MLAIFYYVILLCVMTLVDILFFINLMIVVAYPISNNGASHLNTHGYQNEILL